MPSLRVVSLFTGCGGLDLGFEQSGHFDVIWANEMKKYAVKTYSRNFHKTVVDKRDIRKIPSNEIPDCDGVIGGPPCQPFSIGGARRGGDDPRGTLVFEFVRVVADKRPKFFVIENVASLAKEVKYRNLFTSILDSFKELGYNVQADVLISSDYNVAQTRKRLFIVGTLNSENAYIPPSPSNKKLVLRDVIADIESSAKEANRYTSTNPDLNGHEYASLSVSKPSRWFMSHQRVRGWDEQSYTILATVSSVTLHPSCKKMIRKGPGDFAFDGPESTYRRLTVRECARIQGFPDEFYFVYKSLASAHRMVGNAVPPPMGKAIAESVYNALVR